jgi:hypothetical protein
MVDDNIFENQHQAPPNNQALPNNQDPPNNQDQPEQRRARTLGEYFIPSHQGYRNTIELPQRANVSPLRSDIIRLVQIGCAFHGLWSEDPNQHLMDFLKIVDSIDLDVATC